MTWDGRDATYSPVPQPPQPWSPPSAAWASPSSPPPAYAPQPQPYAHAQFGQTPPPPTAPKKRSKVWIAVLAGVLFLALLITGIAVLGSRQTGAMQEISDSEGRVTVRVPASWDDYSEPVDEPDPAFDPDEDAQEKWDYPVVDTEAAFSDKILLVFAEAISERSVDALQAHGVQQFCYEDCELGPLQPVTIDGRVGIQQELSYDDGGVTVIATVQSTKWTVQIVAEDYGSIFGTTDPGPLHQRVNAVTIHD